MSKLQAIVEQTELLLKKQKEVMDFYKNEFVSLYSLLESEQEKAEKKKSGEDLTSFQNVYHMLSQYEKDAIEYIKEEIEFLEEQLRLFDEVKKLPDEDKQEEIVATMLEGADELVETERFEADIEAEVEEVKAEYRAKIDDIKSALIEDGVKELEVLLEAYIAAQEAEEDDEDEEDELCCGGSESDCSSCESCCGINIFEGLEDDAGKDE
ncbi:hypothetical protein KKA53_03025 [Candidatus Dependentiae bacterium]|nr:hypothetical protein [Candidatus Dependentiae bacterium]